MGALKFIVLSVQVGAQHLHALLIVPHLRGDERARGHAQLRQAADAVEPRLPKRLLFSPRHFRRDLNRERLTGYILLAPHQAVAVDEVAALLNRRVLERLHGGFVLRCRVGFGGRRVNALR